MFIIKKAYQVGLVEYVTENVYQVLSNIYPEGQDNRPFPDHLPMGAWYFCRADN